MAGSEFEQLVGKALLDSTFRAKLLMDPKGTASSLGVQLTEDQVARIQENSRLFEWWAAGFRELQGQIDNYLW